ncbi:MAG: hypothetical protein R8F63_19955 [Acidimicrobiales bacterium]|nr:hypothetical protein [Acidimicrobiales bacterium]
MVVSTRARLAVLFAVLALVAAACGDDGGGGGDDQAGGDDGVVTDETTTTSTTTTVPGTTQPIPDDGTALVDLQVSVVEFGDEGFVTIVNQGDEDVDLNGINLCQFPNYQDLGTIVDGATLAAGASIDIAAEHWGGLDAASGEAALYEGSNFGSPDGMLSYVQWGEGGHERASVAADAGLWPSADAFVTPDPAFNNIESGGFAADPESWS